MENYDMMASSFLGKNPGVMEALKRQVMAKADTFTQATGLVWYDLSPLVELLYPFKELIPRISRLPRIPGNGGVAHHWQRIVAINTNNVSIGVSEGNRGGRIQVNRQDQSSTYKYMGLESSVTFEARLAAMNLNPDALGNNIQSTLRSVMIGEEQSLILGNAGLALGTTPTPSLSAGGSGGTFAGATVYVICVALSGFGWLNGTVANGIPGLIERINADGSTDTYGGGSAAPSAESSQSTTTGQVVTASVTAVTGAVAYAWFVGTTSGQEKLAIITQGNEVILTKNPSSGQLASALVGDNSQNPLLPDGMITQCLFGSFGTAPSTQMATNPNLPSNIAINANSGSLIFTGATANTGLTIEGSNIAEFDALLQAGYDQYKVPYDRILMSSVDIANFLGAMLNSGSSATPFMSVFDAAEGGNGKIVAGRRVTSYINKFFGNELPIEIHPYMPPGTIMFWSDKVPYELPNVSNILQVRTRMDYYQIQWPLVKRVYEYGVYMDEVFENTFPPAYALLQNLNAPSGVPKY